MSKMYGKRRVVLEKNGLATICGSDEESVIHPGSNCGHYEPLGFWYKLDGLFYANLRSKEQRYESFNWETIENKHLAGVPNKQALREFIMEYWNKREEV